MYGFRDGRRPGPGGSLRQARSTLTLAHPLCLSPSLTHTHTHALAYLGRRRRSCPAVPVRRATSHVDFAFACIAVELGIRNNMTNLRLPARVAGASVGLGGWRDGWQKKLLIAGAGHLFQAGPKPGAPSVQISSLQLRISICPGPRVHGNKLPGPPPFFPHKLSPCPWRVAGWGPEGI